jgi:hypothetical protein
MSGIADWDYNLGLQTDTLTLTGGLAATKQ